MDLVTIGELCARYQRPFREIERALVELQPTLVLNGLPYFCEPQATEAVLNPRAPASPGQRGNPNPSEEVTK